MSLCGYVGVDVCECVWVQVYGCVGVITPDSDRLSCTGKGRGCTNGYEKDRTKNLLTLALVFAHPHILNIRIWYLSRQIYILIHVYIRTGPGRSI